MSGFSGVVKLADLDDFISPSTECVIPLAGAIDQSKAEKDTGEVRPQLIKSKKAEEKTTGQTATIAQVSLSDCLACSGCVTSAETVLLTEQSTDALVQQLTVVPALGEAIRELEKELNKGSGGKEEDSAVGFEPPLVSCINTSASEAVALLLTRDEARRRKEEAVRSGVSPKPLLTSHCPGWTCYAEKSLDGKVVELLSNVRSAEQIQGLYVKNVIPQLAFIAAYKGLWDASLLSGVGAVLGRAARKECTIDSVYHVLVSPCFDRKLEVLRPNYKIRTGDTDSPKDVPSIDLVLGTSEIVTLLKDHDLHLSKFVDAEPSNDPLLCGSHCFVPYRDSSECGGYARDELSSAESPKWTVVKNQDLTHVGRVARAYGFRNVQNIVRRARKRGFDYDFVEIMACPGGCGSGGAQVISDTIAKRPKDSSEVGWFAKATGKILGKIRRSETPHKKIRPEDRVDVAKLARESFTRVHHSVPVISPENSAEARVLRKLLEGQDLSAEWRSLSEEKKDSTVATASSLKW
ncbi:hypothetical protein FOL47_002696 [Perkinsus chesapeaki]|uniref:Iron hydrogenase large subunit C-terminal domain-containing protein n=1 Tax=Perkinsus chesapeaki TaxID=330153 RepID=A0A7J6MC16_PERCH|nr:hypothetical protein FOL47_002696 [Perkinsus chesapeaki]